MSKLIDLTGQSFGFWTVIKIGPKTKNGKTQWLCRCCCGTEKLVTSYSLRSCNSTSCGCNHKPNLISEKFGKLTVVSNIKNNSTRKHWLCKCECGNIIILTTNQLRNLKIISCKNCCKNTNQKTLSDILTEINLLLSKLQKIINTQNLI